MRGQPQNIEPRRWGASGRLRVAGQRSADHYTLPTSTHSSATRVERLMIINTLKHLRSGGSECTPRDWGGATVLMCMIRQVDTANHFVRVLTPLGLVLARARSPTLQSRLPHRNRDINLINISLLHLMFQRHDMHILSAAH